MIEVEHEGRQQLVGTGLMLVTAVIQTFGRLGTTRIAGMRDR